MSTVSAMVRSPSLFTPPYAYASLTEAGARLVFAAGACPIDVHGEVVGGEDVRLQTEQAMRNLEVSLASAGATFADLVRTKIYVASGERSDLVAAWNIYRDAVAPHDPPSTLLGVACLGYPGQLVEIEATAALDPA
jgi:enamine deaminase RidA (YjgF/YER057c/UK114 family)